MSEVGIVSQRLCYICLDPTVLLDEAAWVRPCRCTGTIAWVHKTCILRWVRIRSSLDCPHCLTPFRITSATGLVINAMEYIENRIYPYLKDGVHVMVGSVIINISFTALGIFALINMYGTEETFKVLEISDRENALTIPHLTSYSLLAASTLPWEDYVIKALHFGSKIPVLDLFLPANSLRQFPTLRNKLSFSRIVTRCITLPILGSICGKLFFNDVNNRLTRFILGGLTYLVVKGVVYIYSVEKLMLWLDKIDVLPYLPELLEHNNIQEDSQENTTKPDTQEEIAVSDQNDHEENAVE